MFFWKKDKEKIYEALQSLQSEVDFLQRRSSLQADVLEDLTTRLDRYEQILLKVSKYGFRKDGTPKAKPGRKRQELI
jgi:hypothetical protein